MGQNNKKINIDTKLIPKHVQKELARITFEAVKNSNKHQKGKSN